MRDLDIGLRAVLTADSGAGGVSMLATGGIHQLRAPEKTVEPYVVFGEASDFGLYGFGNSLQADNVFYFFRAVAVDANESAASVVAKIADRLKVVLTNPTLTVTGKTVISCRFDRSYPPLPERDEINQRDIVSRGILAEVWLA